MSNINIDFFSSLCGVLFSQKGMYKDSESGFDKIRFGKNAQNDLKWKELWSENGSNLFIYFRGWGQSGGGAARTFHCHEWKFCFFIWAFYFFNPGVLRLYGLLIRKNSGTHIILRNYDCFCFIWSLTRSDDPLWWFFEPLVDAVGLAIVIDK